MKRLIGWQQLAIIKIISKLVQSAIAVQQPVVVAITTELNATSKPAAVGWVTTIARFAEERLPAAIATAVILIFVRFQTIVSE
jgi:hypothetical protein